MKKLGLILLLGVSALLTNTAAAQNVAPVLDVAPEYPVSAVRREIDGFVTVRFDIDQDGKPHNIEIVEASPARLFNSAVRTAIKRSSFELADGVTSTRVERTYVFDHTAVNNLANRFNFMESAPNVAAN